jgi:hypothetical protein
MPQIGTFTREQSGFTGRIHTFTIIQEITLVPAEPSDTENAPDYRIHLGNDDGSEIGPKSELETHRRAGGRIYRVADRRSGLAAADPRQPVPRRRRRQRMVTALEPPAKRDGKD